MLIGKLDRLVEIKQATFSQNSYGEKVRTSTTIASVFARFEFQKGNTGITFKEGDVLKCAGWKTPALNAPRGNLFEGYPIPPNSMRIYGPDYLR